MSLSDSKPRLYALDAIRGVCAIAVMCYHITMWNGMLFFQLGTFGVYMFYVLSGFSMWYVYAQRPVGQAMLKAFFAARFARIFPLYILTCLLVVAAKWFMMGKDSVLNLGFLADFLLNASFLFGLVEPGRTSIVPGGWSIGIEWVFYIVFPLLLVACRSLRAMGITLVAAMALNLVIANLLLADKTLEEQWIPYTHFPTFLVYFMAGITACEWFMRLQSKGYRLPAPWLGRLAPVAALALIFLYPSATMQDYLTGMHVPLLVAAAMLALVAGSLVPNVSGIERVLYRFLGEISYGTYLLHFFVYSTLQTLLKRYHPDYSLPLLMGLSVSSTLLLAYLTYRYYEAPARRWLNRRLAP